MSHVSPVKCVLENICRAHAACHHPLALCLAPHLVDGRRVRKVCGVK